MKNFKLSLILFLLILSGSLLSNIYVKKQISFYSTAITAIENKPAFIENIKKRFYKQKNLLQLFINKEHIKELEVNILLIEKNIAAGETSDCKDLIIETVCLLSQIEEYMTAVD